jgi:membrane associated rhomboid family serine protease
MTTGRKRSILPYIPGYDNNAVLKLIFFLAGAYIMLALSWAVCMLVYPDGNIFNDYFLPNIALPIAATFKSKPWTLLTYGIFHFPNTFMKMLSDMLWLYCFGSVMQMLVGKKQVIPLFVYSLLAGGVICLVVQLLPGLHKMPPYFLGPSAGLMGLAAAAFTLSPKYRFYLTETFSIPMAVVAGVYTLLAIVGTGFYMPLIMMLAGGGFAGFAYIKLLQAGYCTQQYV